MKSWRGEAHRRQPIRRKCDFSRTLGVNFRLFSTNQKRSRSTVSNRYFIAYRYHNGRHVVRYACEVLSEWRLDAWKPQKIVCGGSHFQGRHLINQIRIKHQKRQQQTLKRTADKDMYDRLSRRRGTETSARSAADYSTTF